MRANKTNQMYQMWNSELAGQVEAVRRQRGRGHAHGSHGHGRPGGQPPWMAQMFGPDFGGFGPGFGPGFGGRGRGRGRGPRARRGDVRSAILDVLASAESDLNGYQVIQQIAERSDGGWRPSPGSVYPTIAQLEDEGLVETSSADSRKVLRLTDAGRTYVEEHADELAALWEPFAEPQDDGDDANLKPVIGQTIAAVWQVAATGTPDQQRRAAGILAETRRQLYGLLADGPEEE
jgi:DNA-binding PadR family transcriptional regulator